jgi:hypothetical protein
MAVEKTRLMRVSADLADMLGWIVEMRPGDSIAERTDPVLRPFVEAEYASIADAVEQIKAVRARHAPSAELGNPVG